MKKAYVRTEIIKYLDSLEKENGNPLSVQDVFNCLPKLLEYLKSDPENELQGLDFGQFLQLVEVGYIIGQQKQHFNAMKEFFS